MTTLYNYIQSGKGRGLRLVLWVSLSFALLASVLIYFSGKSLMQDDRITKFVDSVPSFAIKNGEIQNNDLKWAAFIPGTNIPFVIDTTQTELSLPAPDGVYLTRNRMYRVAENGTQLTQSPLTVDTEVSPAYIHQGLENIVLSFAIGTGIFSLCFSWIGFLINVALSALFGLIIRASLAQGRVWRISAITWVFVQLLALVLSLFGIMIPWFAVFILALINAGLLKKITA